MSSAAPYAPSNWLARCAIAMCPPGERRWMAAMLAEAATIHRARDRFAWMAGAAAIVLSALAARLIDAMTARTRVAVAVTLVAACSLRALAWVEFEALGADDDVFLVASGIAAAVFAGVALAIVRAVFQHEVLASG